MPPPYLGTAPLGDTPGPAAAGDDPILSAYDEPAAGAEPTDQLPIGPDEVTAFLVGVGDLLARLRGPHWAIEPAETAVMAPAIARQLNSPSTSPIAAWIARHGDAAAIIVGTALIVVPRALTEYQVIRLRREQLAAAREGVEWDGSYGPAEQPAATWPEPGVSGAGGEADVSPRPTDPESLAAALGAFAGR